MQYALTGRELNGEDVTSLIERITSADLNGARSISAVLHGRLARIGTPERMPATWVQRTPENAPELAREAAQAIDARIAALGIRHAEKPEPWLARHLGAFPIHGSPLEQQDYLHRAGSAAGYREAAGIVGPDQAVSRPRTMTTLCVTGSQRHNHNLEIREEEQLYRAMSKGELEAKEHQAQRAYATGPKDVSAQRKHTALAEADQRQAAAEAQAQGDEATATVLLSLAELLGTQKAALEAEHAKHRTGRHDCPAPQRGRQSPRRACPPRPGIRTQARRDHTGMVAALRARLPGLRRSTSPTLRHKPKLKAGHGPADERARSPGRG